MISVTYFALVNLAMSKVDVHQDQSDQYEDGQGLVRIVMLYFNVGSWLLNWAICRTSISSAMNPGTRFSHPFARRKFSMSQWLLGGTTPPELRAPLRSRRASIICIYEIIMMTEVWQSCLTFWKCSTRPPKVKNKFYVSRTHYFKCLSTVST